MAPPPSFPDDLFLRLQDALAGRYSLERELGRGGMGIVYLAHDVRLDRPVALKLLPPERAARADQRERFLHEARIAARLAHPNIVAIHSGEESGEFVYYAMRYVEGETLGARLRRVGHLSAADTAGILRDTAYALAYAHAQHVIHRDIKPDNILLEAGTDRVLVTDFGIAQLGRPDDSHAARIVGTPAYLSPEQAAGAPVDGRSDLYSLGAVGYHCLAGRPPFEGDTQQLLAQHLTRPAPPVRDAAPGTPAILAAALARALAKQRDDRFATAEDFADAVSGALAISTEMTVPVRVWVERGRELKGIYVIWSCFFYGIGVMGVVAALINGVNSLAAWLFPALCAASALGPWVAHGLWRISETRKALEAGADFEDLRLGARLALARREEELRYEGARPVHILARLVRVATYAAFAGAVAVLVAGMFWGSTMQFARIFFQAFAALSMLTVGGALFGLVFPGRRLKSRDTFGRLRCWLWGSAIGTAMARVAAIGLPVAAQLRRRTATSNLGQATETLFDELPSGERAALHDLPVVVARLEQEAAHARMQLAEHADPVWAERLERTVAAIESLRIGLLRMTTGHAAGHSLTADLDAARELCQRIDYLIAGTEAVAELLARTTPPPDVAPSITPLTPDPSHG